MIPARTRQDEINDVHIEIEKKGREEKAKKQECSVGTMLTTWVSTGGAHHDDDGHTQALIALTWVIKMKSLSCCLLYTSPSPRDGLLSRMPSSA